MPAARREDSPASCAPHEGFRNQGRQHQQQAITPIALSSLEVNGAAILGRTRSRVHAFDSVGEFPLVHPESHAFTWIDVHRHRTVVRTYPVNAWLRSRPGGRRADDVVAAAIVGCRDVPNGFNDEGDK